MKFARTLSLVGILTLSVAAQDKPSVVKAASSKVAPQAGLPACMRVSAQRGDPAKGAAVILIKMISNCKVPWHWHTAGEGLMIVSGRGKIEMKDAAASSVGPADYVYLPGKHPHQFTCVSACTLFDVTEGAFDIHYIDKDGNEITPGQAFTPAPKPATKAGPKK